jgi:NAD(P)H-flavin reductase
MDPLLPAPFQVARIIQEAPGVFTHEYRPLGGALQKATVTSFRPGQFNMVTVFGVGEVPVSISSDPSRTDAFAHTVRMAGSVTRALSRLAWGDGIGLRGPFGNPWPMEAAEGTDLVVVAGGIGLAPLRSVVLDALARRDRYGNLNLMYGARSPSEILYTVDLHAWRARFDMKVEVTVDRAGPAWHGAVGMVTNLIARARFDPLNTTAMVCGPEVMMRAVAGALLERGLGPEQIHLSMERNMKCGLGWCGHCQFGPAFVCKDGPVFRYDRVAKLLAIREV